MRSTRLAFAALLCAAGTAQAAPGYLEYGSGLTLGTASTYHGVPGSSQNPAANGLALPKDSGFRSGILNLANIGLEIGPVDNFVEEIEDLEDALDQENITADEADALKARFDELLVQIGDQAYLTLDVNAQVPMFPMVFRAFGGAVGVDLGVAATVRSSVLDAPLVYNEVQEKMETRTAAYIKSGIFSRVGLSYARPWHDLSYGPLNGTVHIGGRLNVIQGRLSKQIAALDSSSEDDAFDRAQDNYDANEATSTGVGVDFGLMFAAERYQLGLNLKNLTAPKFDYGPVGVNCASIADEGQREDCFVAQSFGDEIALNETFELEPQATVEGLYRILGSNWTVNTSLDLNEVNNVVGDKYQWWAAGLGYRSQRFWLPALRLGLRQNLAGSKLSTANVGLTLFGVLNLDVSYGLETVEYDGTSAPRNAGINLGFEMPL